MRNSTPVFVLDCNVLIDALAFPKSFGRRAFDRALCHGTIVYSHQTLAELIAVIYRKHFDAYITDAEREAFLWHYTRTCALREVTHSVTVCRDPKDNMFLELALSARAQTIITRDKDLLVLSPFEGIEIIEPKSFIEKAIE